MKTFKFIVYLILSWTWNIIMTLIGAVTVGSICLFTWQRPKRFGWSIYVEVGNYWGGCDLGMFFICSKNSSYNLKCHELGHNLSQGIYLGPLFPFLVAIPSASRYWLREVKTQKSKYIFASILTGLGLVLSITITVLGGCFNILWLTILGAILVGYFIWRVADSNRDS